MLVRQAIVSSPGSRALKENELTSCSEGIDQPLARQLCLWSPGRTEFDYRQTQSTNFFQPDAETFALSRSTCGLDNNRDEGHRVVSKIILFDRGQLRGYRNNIALLAHALSSSGRLFLQPSQTKHLPLLDIADRGFEPLGEFSRSELADQNERIAHAVDVHRRVVVLGLKSPLSYMCSFLATIEVSARLEFTFATGLKVEDDRRFALQFFPDSEPEMIKDLASRQIRTISLDASMSSV